MDFSSSALFVNLFVSAVGFGIFLYGKKQKRLPQLVAGLALMIYPYFVGGAVPMIAVGLGIVGALWLGVRNGL